jgi:hypothetical protein
MANKNTETPSPAPLTSLVRPLPCSGSILAKRPVFSHMPKNAVSNLATMSHWFIACVYRLFFPRLAKLAVSLELPDGSRGAFRTILPAVPRTVQRYRTWIDEHKPTAALSAGRKGKTMKAVRLVGVASIGLLSFRGLVSRTAVAQTTKVEGIIKSRSGPDMILKTSQDPDFVVLLTRSTDVGQVQGLFKARRKQMSMAALIPSLALWVEGRYKNVLAARKVRFKGDDLKQAAAVEAGMHDVKTQVQQNQAELERQNAELKAQTRPCRKHQAAIEANQAKIAANKAAVDAAVAPSASSMTTTSWTS